MAKVWRDRGKERFWRQHLAAWRRSGCRIRDYCRSAGLSEPSFYAWRRMLAERQAARRTVAAARKQAERQEQSTTAAAFVPVRLIAEPAATAASAVAGSVEVVVRGGRVVRVAAGFAAATLREVVAVLEGLPC